MPSKVVARLSIVNIAIVLLIGAAGCSASPAAEADEYLEEAKRAHDAERVADARLLAEMALEEGRRQGEARELLAEISRNRAEAMMAEEDYLRAHSAYLDAAELETSRTTRGRDIVGAMEAAEMADLPVEEQLELAFRALEDLPHERDIHRNVARIAEDRGDDSLAAEHYLWLFSADPEDTHSGLRLGIIYLALEQPADAASVLKRVYEQQPENVQAALNLANAYAILRHDDEASELFQHLLDDFPGHPAILRHYAEFEEGRGEREKARRLREKAGEASPGIEPREMRPLQ